MTDKARALVDTVDFRPLMHLLHKGSASGVLVYALTERWWNTTHTFYIADQEITMTPYDFHRMSDLRSHGPIINLEDEPGIQFGIDLLGHAHFSEHIRYIFFFLFSL